jgi:Tfp pilus assembly protein PilF
MTLDPASEADRLSNEAFVLVKEGRLAEAEQRFERALQLELQATSDESEPGVVKARYFLGEHYLRRGEAESARRVVAPSLEGADKPLAWIVEAEALYLCGGTAEARAAGERALALALGPEQRERIRERLSPLWDEDKE